MIININSIFYAIQLYNEVLSVPEAHNPINTVGMQCGVAKGIPMRAEEALHHINQQGSVPLASRISMSDPPHIALRFVWG